VEERAESVYNKLNGSCWSAEVERSSVLYPHSTCHVATELYRNSGGVRSVGVRRRQACGKNVRPTGVSRTKGESCTRSNEIRLCLCWPKVAEGSRRPC